MSDSNANIAPRIENPELKKPELTAPAKAEILPALEKIAEKRESYGEKDEKSKAEEIKKEDEMGLGRTAITGAVTSADAERERQIEKILSEGLDDIYLDMTPAKKMEFKIVGERTAMEINSLLDKAKFKAVKIVELIKKWLSIIPGINKFFIEQEAKIRTDKILKLRR